MQNKVSVVPEEDLRDYRHCGRKDSYSVEMPPLREDSQAGMADEYLMGHSDIGVTLNTYTHLGLEDATDELRRMEDLENARKELEKNKEEKPVSQKMFRAI